MGAELIEPWKRVVGELVGAAVVGVAVGNGVGFFVGVLLGSFVGISVGLFVGLFVGVSVGLFVGLFVGTCVGLFVGFSVGVAVGFFDGANEDTTSTVSSDTTGSLFCCSGTTSWSLSVTAGATWIASVAVVNDCARSEFSAITS